MDIRIGEPVACTDGDCGEVTRLVLDPMSRDVTHLGVAPAHHDGIARLVPLELVASGTDGIQLSCTVAQLHELPHLEEVWFLPTDVGELWWPWYVPEGPAMPVVTDQVPTGEVAVHRGDHLLASDGSIGHVEGFVVAPDTGHISHVLLQEGHLWGRKEVAIPVKAISGIDEEGVHVAMTKDEIGDLPPVSAKRAGD